MCLRIAEIDQHAVAHIFSNETAKALDLCGHCGVVSAEHLAQILWVEPRRECGGADAVADHYRQLSSLCSFGRRCRSQTRRRARFERSDRAQHPLAVAENDAELLKI